VSFTAKVRCAVCGYALATKQYPSLREMLYGSQGLVVSCHATEPHCQHQLELSFDPPQALVGGELIIECLHSGCRSKDPWRTKAPLELVGALTLLFHTAHEGHSLKLSYAGQTWQTPRP